MSTIINGNGIKRETLRYSGERPQHVAEPTPAQNGNGTGNGNSKGQHGHDRVADLPVCSLYERTNVRGQRYLVGKFGHLTLVALETSEVSRGERVWEAFFRPGKRTSSKTLVCGTEEEVAR